MASAISVILGHGIAVAIWGLKGTAVIGGRTEFGIPGSSTMALGKIKVGKSIAIPMVDGGLIA